MDEAAAAGRRLAERHAEGSAPPVPEVSLVNYAESPRAGDWTLRSAMTRLAQPEPLLVDTIAPLVRRLDAVLHYVARPLEKTTVTCDRALSLATVDDEPVDPYPDTRVADLARLADEAGADGGAVIDGYAAIAPLGEAETSALPLLGVALAVDRLADALVEWALVAPAPAPVELVTATCASVQARLDDLGVPVEDGPPPRGGRRRG